MNYCLKFGKECFILFLVYLFTSCTQKAVEVSSVSLNTSTVEMVEGDTYSLGATVLPNNAEYDGISWASSNTSVASVNQGTITALKEGKTTITASAGGKSATCSVTVSAKYIAVTSITLDKSELSLKVGSSDVLTATVKPDDATDKNVKWSSSDASIVKVDNGKVSALKSGTATITATAGSCSAECIITVPVETESISLDKTELSIAIGETATLTATITPADASDQTIIWTSSNEEIVKVNDGTVKGIQAGTATVTATNSGLSASCTITVIIPDNIITYTSTNGKVVTPYNAYAFGANIVSNEYTDGVGIIVFDGPVTMIGNAAFKLCTTLKNINLPNTVTIIGKDSFRACNYLSCIDIPELVSSIGECAFHSCLNLCSVNLPNNLKTIGQHAFTHTWELKQLKLNHGLQSIGCLAFYNSGITEINIPGSVVVTKDKFSWFFSCNSLKKVEFEEGFEGFAFEVFYECGQLTDVIFPTTLKTFSKTFNGCVNLTNVYMKSVTPPDEGQGKSEIKNYYFSDSNNVTIWVPMSAVETYKNDDVWGYWADRIKGYDYQ